MKLSTDEKDDYLFPLWEITKTCFSGAQLPSLDMLADSIYTGDVWVAWHNRRVVGYALVVPWGKGPLLQAIAVLPEWRKKGLGEYLLSKVATHFTGKVDKIFLHCKPDNFSAIRLYERAGYVRTKRLPNYYAPEGDGLEMEKTL